MSILEELIKYCECPEPLGCLLLTGEWGCGKTFFIEDNLKKAIEGEHIIIRISLFGINSANDLRDLIKQKWLELYLHQKGIENIFDYIIPSKKFLPEIIKNERIRKLLQYNYWELIKISNRIGNKNVILVFDDLERSIIDTSQVFGIINDYYENNHFHIIIIANESFLIQENRNSKTIYKELKEKVVQLSLPFIIDYNLVIAKVINRINNIDESYKNFLVEQKQNLSNLFTGNVVDESTLGMIPHNIRIFQFALLDFERVYKILRDNKIEDQKKFLFSFVSCYMVYKSNVIKENDINEDLLKKITAKLYPSYFCPEFSPSPIIRWIMDNIWDENAIEESLKYYKNIYENLNPEDELRINDILNMEEERIQAGFPQVLQWAYNGILTIDEYTNFIVNANRSYVCHFNFPCEINWERVEKGIFLCMQKILNNDAIQYTRKEISTQLYVGQNAYKIISSFLSNNESEYSANRNFYLAHISDNSYATWLDLQSRTYKCFDKEMAKITFDALTQLSNKNRCKFQEEFITLCNNCFFTPRSINGFKTLIEYLIYEIDKLNLENRQITSSIFLSLVDKLIDIISRLGEQTDNE